MNRINLGTYETDKAKEVVKQVKRYAKLRGQKIRIHYKARGGGGNITKLGYRTHDGQTTITKATKRAIYIEDLTDYRDYDKERLIAENIKLKEQVEVLNSIRDLLV